MKKILYREATGGEKARSSQEQKGSRRAVADNKRCNIAAMKRTLKTVN